MNEQPSQESRGVMKGMRGLMWLGIGAALTVDRRNKDLILLAVGTEMLTLAGMAAYLLPLAAHLDDLAVAQAAKENCHHGWCGLAVAVYITWVYLLWSTVLVLLGSVITGLIRKRRAREKKKPALTPPLFSHFLSLRIRWVEGFKGPCRPLETLC